MQADATSTETYLNAAVEATVRNPIQTTRHASDSTSLSLAGAPQQAMHADALHHRSMAWIGGRSIELHRKKRVEMATAHGVGAAEIQMVDGALDDVLGCMEPAQEMCTRDTIQEIDREEGEEGEEKENDCTTGDEQETEKVKPPMDLLQTAADYASAAAYHAGQGNDNEDERALEVVAAGRAAVHATKMLIEPAMISETRVPIVGVSVQIIAISKVDTVHQVVFMNFVVICHWQDIEVARDYANLGKHSDFNDPKSARRLFKPDVQIRNTHTLRCLTSERQRVPRVLDAQMGLVKMSTRYSGSVDASFDLSAFPFDAQQVPIKLRARNYRGERTGGMSVPVVLLKDSTMRSKIYLQDTASHANYSYKNGTRTVDADANDSAQASSSSYAILEDWLILSGLNERAHQIVGTVGSKQDQTRHDFDCSVTLIRQHSKYTWDVALQMAVISTLAFSSFLHSADELQARMTCTLILILTATGIKFYTSQYLPRLAYQTLLDKYLIFCFFTLTAVAAENCVSFVTREVLDDYEEQHPMNGWWQEVREGRPGHVMQLLIVAGWVLSHLALGIYLRFRLCELRWIRETNGARASAYTSMEWRPGAFHNVRKGLNSRLHCTVRGKNIVVVDAGGGALNLYVDNHKESAPSYSAEHNEYNELTKGNPKPFVTLLVTELRKIQRNLQISEVKVGITGKIRGTLGKDEGRLQLCVEKLRKELRTQLEDHSTDTQYVDQHGVFLMECSKMEKMEGSKMEKKQRRLVWRSTVRLEVGVLSREQETLLEQQSIISILDSTVYQHELTNHSNTLDFVPEVGDRRKNWIVFNMGGSDLTIITRSSKRQFANKGAKFAVGRSARASFGQYWGGADSIETGFRQHLQQLKESRMDAIRAKEQAIRDQLLDANRDGSDSKPSAEAGTLNETAIRLSSLPFVLCFTGFFGYIFSMPICAPVWEAIIVGRPFSVDTARQLLAKAKELLIYLIERADIVNRNSDTPRASDAGVDNKETRTLSAKTMSSTTEMRRVMTRVAMHDAEKAKLRQQLALLEWNNASAGNEWATLTQKLNVVTVQYCCSTLHYTRTILTS
jgi:hypothetical protein